MSKPTVVGSVFMYGDITLGENVTLFHGASLRADEGTIKIGNCSNVQENCSLHVDLNHNLNIGDCVTIGHNAVVHGCTVKDNVIIGMGAIILNDAVIGKNSIIGAGAVIGQGKVIEEGSIVVGNPYKVIRKCSEKDIEQILNNAKGYVKLGEKYKKEGF